MRENYQPLFSHLFGLHPWDVKRLTVSEFRSYKAWADEWMKSKDGG